MSQKPFEKIELPSVKNIIVIASGKGGVGKSTVAAGLAVSMARQGNKTALVDADLYGPSIPVMFGVEKEQVKGEVIDGKEVMYPVEKYGVKMISAGFFISSQQSLIWRGPMASNALTQLFRDTRWGDIDYMIIDFPPGTGDIQLTTVQKLNLTGAVIVTTPQDLAVADARKAAAMFTRSELQVPLLGVVENMSWFSPLPHPDEKYYIFGKGGGEKLAVELNTRLAGQIPLVMEIGEVSDKGLPIYESKHKGVEESFNSIANVIKEATEIKQ